MPIEVQNGTAKNFDRAQGALEGLPGVLKTKASPVTHVNPISGDVQTYIVQTYRQRDEASGTSGDHVFLQYVDGDVATRIHLPPKVASVIARQRDQLTGRSRSTAAKANAQARLDAGWTPTFGGKRGKRRRKNR